MDHLQSRHSSLTQNNEERLREACCYGDIDIVGELIQKGVDVNSKNSMNGWTALHWSCQRGHSSAVELLLRYGADPTAVNNRNQTPGQLTSLPHIRAKLGYADPALTPSSPTNTPNAVSLEATGSGLPALNTNITAQNNNNSQSVGDLGVGKYISNNSFGNAAANYHNRNKANASSSLTTQSPPPFPNIRASPPPPLLASPPCSPSPPPPYPATSDTVSSQNQGRNIKASATVSSNSPPPLPSSPTAIEFHRFSRDKGVLGSTTSASQAVTAANSFWHHQDSPLGGSSRSGAGKLVTAGCVGGGSSNLSNASSRSGAASSRSSGSRSSSISSSASTGNKAKRCSAIDGKAVYHMSGNIKLNSGDVNLNSPDAASPGKGLGGNGDVNGCVLSGQQFALALSDHVSQASSVASIKDDNSDSDLMNQTMDVFDGDSTDKDGAIDDENDEVTISDGDANYATAGVDSISEEGITTSDSNCTPPPSFADIFSSQVSFASPRFATEGQVVVLAAEPPRGPGLFSEAVLNSREAEHSEPAVTNGFLETSSSGLVSSSNFESAVQQRIVLAKTCQGAKTSVAVTSGNIFEEGDISDESCDFDETDVFQSAKSDRERSSVSESNPSMQGLQASKDVQPEQSFSEAKSSPSRNTESVTNLIRFTSNASLNDLGDLNRSDVLQNRGLLDNCTVGQLPLMTGKVFVNLIDETPSELEGILGNQIHEQSPVQNSRGGNSNNSNVPPHSVSEEHKPAGTKTTGTDPIVFSKDNPRACCCCCCWCSSRKEHPERNNPETSQVVDRRDKAVETESQPLLDKPKDIIIKIRVAYGEDPDFIEVCLAASSTSPTTPRTYATLLQLCCTHLHLNPHHVERLRKMPNTRLRNDDDVARLRDEAEVEVVMRGVAAKRGGGVTSPRVPAFNGQPIIY